MIYFGIRSNSVCPEQLAAMPGAAALLTAAPCDGRARSTTLSALPLVETAGDLAARTHCKFKKNISVPTNFYLFLYLRSSSRFQCFITILAKTISSYALTAH